MSRQKTPGLYKRGDIWHIRKRVAGIEIKRSTRTNKLEDAELILSRLVEEARNKSNNLYIPNHTFREASTRFLEENISLTSICDYANFIKQLDPYLGDLSIESVHMGHPKLQQYIENRKGVKNRTINYALVTIVRILNQCARVWRNEDGSPWLQSVPLIKQLKLSDARKPYPLNWEEQRKLFDELAPHLRDACLFKVNTGTRSSEVCGLRWSWEQLISKDISVFVVPGRLVKNGEDRLIVMNRIARSVVDSRRGIHDEYVFTYKGNPFNRIYNSSFKRARKRVGLDVTAHDLKHTYGRRLRSAGVPLETRKVLLGHTNGDITTHYSQPEIEELLNASNKVCEIYTHKSVTLSLIK